MKKTLALLLAITACALATAQTQQGHVKTIGRPDKKGEALSGVTLRVKGQHNPVVSGNDGRFALSMPGMKNGDAYAFQQVQKTGYELNENDFCSRQQAFSDKVPLEITMVSTAQLQADKQRIEDNALKTAERNYKTKLTTLEQQLADHTISVETYRQELQTLQDKFEKYQSLIDGLAEHYAHTDYDLLDEKDREINLCIEKGELERADSLIHTLFDPLDVLRRNKEALYKLDQQLDQAQGILTQANADMAAVLKQQEKDAEYLYQLYTIALSRYDNEKAQFYIETRAELDTTNVDWQNEAGVFIRKYIADYHKAMTYHQRALKQSLADNNAANMAQAYNHIGKTFEALGEYATALEEYRKALEQGLKEWSDSDPNVADIYINLGGVNSTMGDYDKAMEYNGKALDILKSTRGENHPSVAQCHNNMGMDYRILGQYDKALEHLEKAEEILLHLFGEKHLDVALNHVNIGSVYGDLGEYSKELEYLEKALQTRLAILGNKHPDVADVYNNIATAYGYQLYYHTEIEYLEKAHQIWVETLGENHPVVFNSYYNMGDAYLLKGDAAQQKSGQATEEDYLKALEYFEQALRVVKTTFGENHRNEADCYDGIAMAYGRLDDSEKSLEYMKKALDIYIIAFGENHPDVALCYENIGGIYEKMGDSQQSMEALQKCLEIRRSVFGELHPDVAKTLSLISYSHTYMGHGKEALEYEQQALKIRLDFFGENHPLVAQSYWDLANRYDELGDHTHALEYHKKAKDTYKTVWGEKHPMNASCLFYIGLDYTAMEDYPKALESFEEALEIGESFLGSEHPFVMDIKKHIEESQKKIK